MNTQFLSVIRLKISVILLALVFCGVMFFSFTPELSPASASISGPTPAVFRPSTSTWFAQRSTAGTLIQQFDITGDIPLPSAYVR